MTRLRELAAPIGAMAAIVVASNILVQFPFEPLGLADLLTWGAFTYPLAFFVTDLTNRRFGPARARAIVLLGFVAAVALSAWLATPRIAVASGTAFLVAQLIDVSVFDRLRRDAWWRPPLVSSIIGSLADTAIFFSLAFAAGFAALGANDPFAIAPAPLLGLLPVEAPRWISWAIGDLGVKLGVAVVLLGPYALARRAVPRWEERRPARA